MLSPRTLSPHNHYASRLNRVAPQPLHPDTPAQGRLDPRLTRCEAVLQVFRNATTLARHAQR